MKRLVTLASLLAVTACASAAFAVSNAAALPNECQLVTPKMCVTQTTDRYGCIIITYTNQQTGAIIARFRECPW